MALLASLAIISCGSNTSEESENQVPVENQVPASDPVLSGISPLADSGTKTETGVPAQTPVQSATGMNPEHGMPGHRCDIAVGAPLNSPPATPGAMTPTPSMTVTPGMNGAGSAQVTPTQAPAGGAPGITVSPFSPGSATPAPQPAAKTMTAPGMNPPHGEPGHDCAIAVGAPLKK
jgi:hypothetical protein